MTREELEELQRRSGGVYTPAELRAMASIGQTGAILGGRLLAPQASFMVRRADAIHEAQTDAQAREKQRQLLDRYYGAQEAKWGADSAEDKRQFDADLGYKYAKLREDAALRRELKAMGLDATNAEGEKLTAAQAKEANEWGALRDDVADVRNRVKQTPGVASPWKQAGVLTAEALVPERFEPWARKRAEGSLFTADERQTRQALREQVAARVKALSGAAASDSERAFIMSFMPGENDSLDDLNNSLDRLYGYAEQRAKRSAEPRGSLQQDRLSGPRNRRTVGGKSWVQVGPDEWEEE